MKDEIVLCRNCKDALKKIKWKEKMKQQEEIGEGKENLEEGKVPFYQ